MDQGGDRRDAVQELADAWSGAERVVVLTGAGISTASGIPDFRSPGGRWENYQPVTFQEFMTSQEMRVEYWRYKGETWRVMAAARPNAAHDALSALADEGRISLLVTQNVDGLHQRSGFPAERLITIHGTDAEVECMSCGRRTPRQPAQEAWEAGEAVPMCSGEGAGEGTAHGTGDRCGGWLKPAVISFGQSLVAADLRRAFVAAEECDLFVAVGTSLVVSPINQTLVAALRAGARTAILTASETPFDDHVDWKIDAPVEACLPRIHAAI